MSDTPSSERRQRIRRQQRSGNIYRLLNALSLVVAALAILLIVTSGLRGRGAAASDVGDPRAPGATRESVSGISVSLPTATATLEIATATAEPPVATATPDATPEAARPLVALIAGHRNNDSGAVCESGVYQGLTEVQITTAVTDQLASILTARGYDVITLDEFDPQQNGLVAAALISIHVDSCVEWAGTTGFKAARSSDSAIPEVEDRLVACLVEEYGRATGLALHPGTVTHNMTNYHAFRRVDMNTPAAIIELGFLFHDHDLLVDDQEVIVEGLRRGVDCFLR